MRVWTCSTCADGVRRTAETAALIRAGGDHDGVLHATASVIKYTRTAGAVAPQEAEVLPLRCDSEDGWGGLGEPADSYGAAAALCHHADTLQRAGPWGQMAEGYHGCLCTTGKSFCPLCFFLSPDSNTSVGMVVVTHGWIDTLLLWSYLGNLEFIRLFHFIAYRMSCYQAICVFVCV